MTTSTPTDHTLAALHAHAAAVERFLEGFVASLDVPGNLRDAIAYALLGGGKRLRPVLCRLGAELLDADPARATAPAAALELVHAFSLVHDDLPALDNDALRRGRPTLHVHAGEAMAILAGDAMLTLAFTALAEPVPGVPPTSPAQRAALTTELASATTAMIAGQVYDTLGGFDPALSAEQRVRLTHARKTGALLRAACRMGAIAADADPHALDALSRFGDAVGLMYQVVDDLIDVEQEPHHAGKQTRKDADAGKHTYPGVLGVERSRALARELAQRAADALAPFGRRAATLIATTEYLANRTR